MTQEQKLHLIFKHMHTDYKSGRGELRSILILRSGGTHLVPLTALTDDEIERLLPYALKKEQRK
jgi:hypothetical protein